MNGSQEPGEENEADGGSRDSRYTVLVHFLPPYLGAGHSVYLFVSANIELDHPAAPQRSHDLRVPNQALMFHVERIVETRTACVLVRSESTATKNDCGICTDSRRPRATEYPSGLAIPNR